MKPETKSSFKYNVIIIHSVLKLVCIVLQEHFTNFEDTDQCFGEVLLAIILMHMRNINVITSVWDLALYCAFKRNMQLFHIFSVK